MVRRAPGDAARWVRSSDVVSRSIGDETILVPVKDRIVDLQCLFTLNATGAFVWDQLARPRTIDELGAALSREFTVSTAQARTDARRLVRQLVRERCAHEVTTERSRAAGR